MMNLDDLVNQIQQTVRDMEDSGFLNEVAEGAEKIEIPQDKGTLEDIDVHRVGEIAETDGI